MEFDEVKIQNLSSTCSGCKKKFSLKEIAYIWTFRRANLQLCQQCYKELEKGLRGQNEKRD